MSVFDRDVIMVRDLYLAEEKRNTRVQKFCGYCGAEFLGEIDDDECFCAECRVI
jgi:ribosomal protein S27AE